MNDTPNRDHLKDELDRAYSQLAEITSRLLAVNEAADLMVKRACELFESGESRGAGFDHAGERQGKGRVRRRERRRTLAY